MNNPTTSLESETRPQISATEPDWDREKLTSWWYPSRQLLKSIRGYQKWRYRWGLFGRLISAVKIME